MSVYKVQVTKEFSDQDMEDIVITALEGGIGYWACLDNTTPEFKDEPEDTPTFEWCWKLLKEGKYLRFLDAEDTEEGEVWYLNLTILLNGIGSSIAKGYWDGNLDNVDGDVADSIFQLAMFGDVIYG